jgi:hypothetical protein
VLSVIPALNASDSSFLSFKLDGFEREEIRQLKISLVC